MAMSMNNNSSNSRSRRALISEINVTPLVDVMLVLLIIFMITAPMLVSGVKIDLPDAQAKPLNSNEEPLTITLDRHNNLFIAESSIKREKLINKLKAITKEKYSTRIFIRADKNLHYGEVIKLVADLNVAGFNHVALVTSSGQ